MTRLELQEHSRDSLRGMAAAGITKVEILGSGRDADDCPACRSLKGGKLNITSAPPLPLPGCTKQTCQCLWLPAAEE